MTTRRTRKLPRSSKSLGGSIHGEGLATLDVMRWALATSVSSHRVPVATAQRVRLARNAAVANNRSAHTPCRPQNECRRITIKAHCSGNSDRSCGLGVPETRCACGLESGTTAGTFRRQHLDLDVFAAQQRRIGTWLALHKMGMCCAPHGAALSNNKNNELKIRKPRRIMAPCFTI